jgi:hypothetical protein
MTVNEDLNFSDSAKATLLAASRARSVRRSQPVEGHLALRWGGRPGKRAVRTQNAAQALSRQLRRARIEAKIRLASCCCDGILPLCGSFGSEDPECGSGDEVALKVEGVVNRTVQA